MRGMLEIRKLLLLVGAAAVLGAVAVGVMVGKPALGRRTGKSVVLAPDILTGELQLTESELQRAWVFSRVDFYDAARRHHEVRPEAYAAFYEMIAGEKSVRKADELACHFEGVGVPTLMLTLDPAGRFAAAVSPRQVLRVEFSPDGQLCRVEGRGGWSYFHMPGVGHEAQRLFVRGR